MRKLLIAAAAVSLVGCTSPASRHGGATGGNGPMTGPSGGGGTTGGGGPAGGPACDQSNMSSDQDGDGYTPAMGDCNDCDPNINPGAVDVMGDTTDHDCDGKVDDHSVCDANLVGKNDPASIAQAIDICDPRFLKSATLAMPPQSAGVNDARARRILAGFGDNWKPHKGSNMVLISTGIAVDEKGSDGSGKDFVNPQDGTALGTLLTNTAPNPLTSLPGVSNCTNNPSVPPTVFDYTELDLEMQAPTNANSFSFDFQFFSGEYPQYVCDMYNDQFLALVKSDKTYPTDTNISFDAGMNPITVNSGFFTICTTHANPKVKNPMPCTTDPSANAGTGYETPGGGSIDNIPGGSTGWLTTTAPIQPGEHFTLRLIIFDEGDSVLDSAALIDSFRWGNTTVSGPSTGPISYRIMRRGESSLMCGA